MKTSSVCILGGTGFVGRHLVNRLAAEGVGCRILTRRPHRHRHVGVARGSTLVEADAHDRAELVRQFAGQDAVINLVGILNEGGGENFRRVHYELPLSVLAACQTAGVPRLLHMSALNADAQRGTSNYLKTKGAAEDYLHANAGGVAVTSFRPSVIFGPDDSFFNRFAALLKIPGPFPLACPKARFAPVYVGDVAEAFARSLDDPGTFDQRYDLCGPRVFTLRELVDYTVEAMGERKPILELNDTLSRLQAKVLGVMPGRPFTMDNYRSMQMDSVCERDGLGRLGIVPTDVDAIVPFVLGQRLPKQRLDSLRRTR
jgi:NADH dehydrogenase